MTCDPVCDVTTTQPLGFPSRDDFLGTYRLATERIRQIYDRSLSRVAENQG